MKRIVICLVIVVLTALLNSSMVTAGNNTDKLVQAFKNATTESGKVQVLNSLIKEKTPASYCAFYQLLSETPLGRLDCFRTILKDPSNIEVLIHMGDYLKNLTKPFLDEAQQLKASGMSAEKIEEKITQKATPVINKFNIRINALHDEIAILSKPNKNRLTQIVQTVWANEEDFSNMEGAILGLIALQEEGFESLLQSVKTNDDETLLIHILPRFGPYVVTPVLKMVENPSSTQKQKKLAQTLIFAFPMTEKVINRMVEAYLQGNFFPKKKITKIPSLKNVLSSLDSAWQPYIIGRLEKYPELVTYIGNKYLNNPKNQERIIYLMNDIDSGRAMQCFRKVLDYNSLSADSLKALIQTLYVPAYEKEKKKKYEPDRFLFVCDLFEKILPDTRAKIDLMFYLDSLSAEHQKTVIVSYFEKLTEKEKETAIYVAGKLNPITRDQTYDKIKKFCNKKLCDTIRYYQDKPSH